MSSVNNFFTTSDFLTILDDFGRQIIHVPITRSISNLSGKETLTDGSPSIIEAYFIRTGKGFDYEKVGLMEKGDSIVLSKYADAVEKDDLIYADGINVEISNIDGGSASISVTTSSAHGLSVGDNFIVFGTTNYNGVYSVATKGTSVLTITDTSHDLAAETVGQINKDYNKFRVSEALNVPGYFDNIGGATTFVYTACSLFLNDED